MSNSQLFCLMVSRSTGLFFLLFLLLYTNTNIIFSDFWDFYAKRHSIFYVCVLHEDNLPPYLANDTQASSTPSTSRRQGLGTISNRPRPIIANSLTQYMNAIGTAHVFLDTPIGNPEADKIAFIKCQSLNHQGIMIDSEGVLIRQGRSVQDLHNKIRRNYSFYRFVPEELAIIYLELRWGPEETVVHPAADSSRILVSALHNRETYVMKVIPICNPSV
jgi:hypothetical protein